MNAKSFPSSVTPMPIVTIQTALTSVHARLDTLGTEKLVQVRTCIEYYSTILQRSRGNTQNHIYTFQAEQRRRSVFKQSGGGGGGWAHRAQSQASFFAMSTVSNVSVIDL